MNEKINFLEPSTAQIRHQITNILESYNHDWDLIAELTQNSVDAIRLGAPVKGHMKLTICASEKRIILEDNGCGIPPGSLPNLLAPFSSNKFENPSLIGSKGVGVSFVIFSSATFQIETHHTEGAARASINGAWSWIEEQSEELPTLTFEHIDARKNTGTKVNITLPNSSSHEFFKLSIEQLEMILRTKTAIGDTRTIWGEEPKNDVLLTFTDLNGKKHEREIDCSYFLPTSKLSTSKYISLRDFQDWNTGDRTDAQKRAKLRDKLIYLDGEKEAAGRKIRYWACFVPKRQAWDTVSVASQLIGKEILDLNPLERSHKYEGAHYLFSGGMYTSTRSMPTGIRSDIIPRGSAGYLPNFFILVDDPQLSFDIGRKSIPGRQLGMLRDVAADVFRNFINSIKRYVSGEPEPGVDEWNRTAMFNEIRDMPDLQSTRTKFIKRPSSQEATIAAMFFEMIGRGDLDNFKPYISGYRNKYDLYSKYNNSDVVLEFKYKLSSLFRDFDNETKLADEVDIVVVWEITENDIEVLHSRGFELEQISEGLSGTKDKVFHYNLTLGSAKAIKVICLKLLVDENSVEVRTAC